MPEYLAPGVYIEEIERGPKPIEGVATSTAAFLGVAERGTTKPRLITNYNEYLRYFGDIFANNEYLPFAVRGFFDNGGRRCYIARIVGQGNATAEVDLGDFKIKAIGPGDWGNRVWARVGPSATRDGAGNPIGFRLQAAYWSVMPPNGLFDPFADRVSEPRPSIEEDFDELSVDPASPNHYEKRINIRTGNSALIDIEALNTPPSQPTALQGNPLQNGANGAAPIIGDYQGVAEEADQRRGLSALDLDEYRDVAIVHAPAVATEIAGAVITHCENNRFRFAVVDSDQNQATATALDPRSARETKYGAFYYPWLFISDPRSGARRKVPPGGYVCGIYARSDNTRGVFKAPANETVRGAIDLEYDINHATQENLNPKGVNVIRRFPGRGIRVWGARTLASDPLWKYVNVRRLFIFLEYSIYNGTQWVVFEPNDHRLWARVKQTVSLFLRTQWREGALFGEKEEEAFSVNVGRETMTEDDILNGRLIIEVGIAPVRPAEFVIFRVFQKTQEAKA
jgi:uncharacterized protein